MTTRNVIIPPPGRPGSITAQAEVRLRLVDAKGARVTPADIANTVLIVGDGVHTITDQGYTLVLTTQDSIPGETYWVVEVPYGRDAPALYRVQIASGADMTWNEFIGAGTTVDPGDIWSARLWPADLAGNAGRWGKVNAQGTAIEYTDAPAGSGDVTGPGSATDGNLAVFDGPSGKVIKDGGPPGTGGASTFLDLTDTPADYTGQAGKVAAVNGTEDGLEFSDPGTGNTDLSNTPSATDVTVESSTGNDTSIAAATQTLAGVLSAADKAKLDGTDAAGTPRPPTAHATTHRTGEPDELTPTDIGAAASATTITGSNSIAGGGDLSANRTLALVNDAASPGINKVYGTDGTGVKKWKDDPAGGGGAVDSVSGQDSVAVSPTTGDTVVSLVNDQATPGNNKVYGTDGAGLRGWRDETGGGGGNTNITIDHQIDSVVVESDTGTDGTIVEAVANVSAGIMTGADKNKLNFAITDAVSDGKNYARKDAGWVQTAEHEAGAGLTLFDYVARLPSGPPAAGEIVLNSPVASTVNTISIHKTDFDGDDQNNLLELIESGDWINVHDASAPDTNRWRYDVQGQIIDQGTYWSVPVIPFDDTGTITDGMRIQLWWRNRAATTRQPIQVISPGANPGTINLEWNTSYLVNPISLSGGPLTLQLPSLQNGRIVVYMSADTPNTHGLDVIIKLAGGAEWGRFIFQDEWFELNSDGVEEVISYHYEAQFLEVNNVGQSGTISIKGGWTEIPVENVVSQKGFTLSGNDWLPRRNGKYAFGMQVLRDGNPSFELILRCGLFRTGAAANIVGAPFHLDGTSINSQSTAVASSPFFEWDEATGGTIYLGARGDTAGADAIDVAGNVNNFMQLIEVF